MTGKSPERSSGDVGGGPGGGAGRARPGVGRAVAAYTAARVGLFGVLLLLLSAAGVRGLLGIAAAVFVSSVLSIVLLRRQRDALTGALARRAEDRAADRARLRGMLDG